MSSIKAEEIKQPVAQWWDALEIKQAAFYLGDLVHLVTPRFDNSRPQFDSDFAWLSFAEDEERRRGIITASWEHKSLSATQRELVSRALWLQSDMLGETPYEAPKGELHLEDVIQFESEVFALGDLLGRSRKMVNPKDRDSAHALLQNIMLELRAVGEKARLRPAYESSQPGDLKTLL